jgi:hypothetical protein
MDLLESVSKAQQSNEGDLSIVLSEDPLVAKVGQ